MVLISKIFIAEIDGVQNYATLNFFILVERISENNFLKLVEIYFYFLTSRGGSPEEKDRI